MRLLILAVSFGISVCPSVWAAEDLSWEELLNRADSLITAGHPDSASVTVDRAIASALTEHGPSDSTVEIEHYRKGIGERWYFLDYADAESLFSIGAKLKEHALGAGHPGVAEMLWYLASVYKQQGEYAEAKSVYERTLLIREEALGPEHPDVGRTLRNLGRVYLDLGDYDEAEVLLKRGLSILERALGTEHPDVAYCLNSLSYSVCLRMSILSLTVLSWFSGAILILYRETYTSPGINTL